MYCSIKSKPLLEGGRQILALTGELDVSRINGKPIYRIGIYDIAAELLKAHLSQDITKDRTLEKQLWTNEKGKQFVSNSHLGDILKLEGFKQVFGKINTVKDFEEIIKPLENILQ